MIPEPIRVLMNRITSYKPAGTASGLVKGQLYVRQVCTRWEPLKDTGSQHLQKGYRTGVVDVEDTNAKTGRIRQCPYMDIVYEIIRNEIVTVNTPTSWSYGLMCVCVCVCVCV